MAVTQSMSWAASRQTIVVHVKKRTGKSLALCIFYLAAISAGVVTDLYIVFYIIRLLQWQAFLLLFLIYSKVLSDQNRSI